MSALTLPEPANWPSGGRHHLRLTLLMAAFVVAALLACAWCVQRGDYLKAVIWVGFVLPGVMMIVAVQVASRRDTSMRAKHDDSGTTFSSDRLRGTMGMLVIAMFIPVSVAFVVFTLTGQLHMFETRRGHGAAVVGMGFVAFIAIWALISAWRRGGLAHVKLTPSGIDIADMTSTDHISWNDVVGIVDHSETKKRARNAIVLRYGDGTEKVIEGADLYVPNGVGLYWMVRHYWRHPDDRPELAEGRALERLHEEQFDISVP